MNFKQVLSILVSISIVFTQTVSAAGIQIDNSASKKPTLSKALNNIPIINIVKPNSSGLSHNKFKNYNVNKQGLILNNSNKAVNTQLSGFIPFNANLQGSHAKVILNEVTGTSRTLLQGFTEVAGVSADVIVANPNGISVNGGGFINTPKATLTTGNPLINSGLLKGFDVSKGDIWIEGDGFNANNINSVALFSKALHVNAKFYANKVDIVLGENIINTNGTITSKDSLGSGIALDSSLLGGIYANTITLVSNDKGVGVNLPPEVFAQNSLNINVNGDITLQKTEVTNSLYVRTNQGNIINNKKMFAKNINLISANDIFNTNSISTTDTLLVNAKNIYNQGSFSSIEDMIITSNELHNKGTLFSAKDMKLYVSNLLYNYENANILAINNLHVSKNSSNEKTKKIINNKANIETIDGDITFYAQEFVNTTDKMNKKIKSINTTNLSFFKEGLYYYDKEWLTSHEGSDEQGRYYERHYGLKYTLTYYANLGLEIRQHAIFMKGYASEIKRNITLTTKEETQGNTPKPATLISGKKLTLHVNKIRNYLSQIASNDTLSIYADILNNEGERLYNIHTLSGRYYYKYKDGGLFHSDKHRWADIPSKTTYKLIGNVYSSIYSAKDIVGNIAVVNNVDIKSNQAPLGSNGTTKKLSDKIDTIHINETTNKIEIKLPKSEHDLFVLSKDKKADFLIETNPKFTIFKNFISSDYMMEKLNLDPLATQKRLGDNFYENRLVRESIFSQTGKRYLSDTINDDYTQYKYLMDNALNQRVALNLTPTVALTQKQINALTSDIVWMEETIVAGEKVLVPHVYIANLDNLKLNDRASAIVAKQNITLQVNSLVNMGKIEAGNNLVILANKTIANLGGKLSSQADTTLIANESIVNISADIKADSLHVATKTFHSDVGITKLKKELDLGEEVNELVSNSSTIQANKNITINTINNLNLIGTDVKAKGDINLASTKGNVNILSKQSNNEFDNKTATGYLKTSQTNQISSNLEANNINITSNSLHVKASNLSAKENINVNVKKSITIEAGENREYSDFKHKIKGSFLGGKLKQQDTIDNTTLITSTLKAKNINLTANQINLIASQIKADEVKITTEVLRLISQKNSSYESHFKDSSGLMTRTIATKGHIKEEVVKAQIEVTKQLILNNKDITNKLQHSGINDKKIQTRISQELQTDNIIKTLSSQHNLTHDQIELVKAYAKSKEWDESHTSLTAIGAIIVAIVVTVCTAGIGTGAAVASTVGATGVTATVTAAVTNAVVAGVATQAATAAITGESFKLDVGALVKGALVAGVLSGVTAFTDSAQGIDKIKYDKLSLSQKITKGVTHSTLKAGVNSAVYGTDFKDGLVSALGGEATNMGFSYVGDFSKYLYLGKGNDLFKDGGLGKIALHGLAGGVGAELTGGDFEVGLASGAMNELLSPYTSIDAKEAGMSQKRADAIEVGFSKLIGGIAGGIVDGGDKGVQTGSNIAESATKYNRQLHEKEIQLIKVKAQKYADEKGINVQEAQRLLYLGAMYYNNEASKNLADKILEFNSNTNENSKYTKQDIKNAFLFLKQESKGMQFKSVRSPYLDDSKDQDYFTSTKEQYEDNSLHVPITIGGMQDASEILIPGGSILKTGAKASTLITKAGIKQADKLYLKTGIKTDAYIQNKVIPSVKDGYYGVSNKFLVNPVKYTQNSIDIVESIPLGIPPYSKIGYTIGGYGLVENYFNNEKK